MKKIVLLSALSCLVILCSTRKPSDPGEGSEYREQFKVENVMYNLSQAIVSGTKNVDKYMECFSDTFTFVADNLDNGDYPGIFDSWGAAQERPFFDAFKTLMESEIGSTANVTASFNHPTGYNFSDEDTMQIFIYNIDIDADSTDTLSIPTWIGGKAYVYFKKVEYYYYITKWEDNRRPGQEFKDCKTWGSVKGLVTK